MRLSSRLSDKSKNTGEIESFIDLERYTVSPKEETEDVQLISAGDFIEIQIGTIMQPFYSTVCRDSVSFVSPLKLHCLIINKSMISIDCELQCMHYVEGNPSCKNCNHSVQAWFLVGADDIFAPFPNVYVIKQNFKLPENIKLPVETEDKFTEWLAKAEIAHKERLGAGSIIYLRSILERITIEVGDSAGVEIRKRSGSMKPFDQVIAAVDKECSIVPVIYSDNGYELFRRLSNIAHGNADEETALREYEPLRRLVVGIMDNVKKKEEEIKNGKDYKSFDEGDIPVYDSGGIMTYIDTSAYDKPSVLIPRKGSLDKLYYVDTPFWNVDTVFYTEIDENIVIPKYVFYCLQKQHLERLNKAGGVPSLTQSVLNKVVVPVPPIEVQSKVVRILDNFTELTAELAARLATELTAKKKQYEYYRDQLLNFACDVSQVKLGDYFPHIRNGFVGTATPYFTTKDNGIRYLKGTNIHDRTISDNDFCYITPEFHQKHIRNELKLNDVLMVQSGHVGECAVVTEQYVGANCHALIIMSNGGNCNSKYVVHYLHTTEGKKKLAAITTGRTVKHILASEMKKFIIPLPSLDEQERIVDILDRLDTHCNDLVSALTTEIEARQKQYEYYRDKLLSFEG